MDNNNLMNRRQLLTTLGAAGLAYAATGLVPGGAAGKAYADESESAGEHSAVQMLSAGCDDGTFNVKCYGALGDGIADDSAAIQDTIDAAHLAGGGTVMVPAGTYLVSTAIRLKSNVQVIGIGKPAVKLIDNASPKPTHLLTAYQEQHIRVENITLDGNGQNNIDHGTPDANGNQDPRHSGTLLALIDIASVDYLTLEKLSLVNSWGSGMWISDCTHVIIKDNFVKDYRITGIAIRNNTAAAGDSNHVQVTGNECSGGIVGIHNIFGTKYILLENNYCYNNTDANRFPSYAYGGTYPNVYPLTGGFKTSSASGYVSPAMLGDGAGIELTGVFTDEGGYSNEGISISGNITHTNMVGIRLEEETKHVVVDNNICYENKTHGIFIFSGSFNVVSDNICYKNEINGINIEKVQNRFTPIQNIINGNICTKNRAYGIALRSGKDNIITNNNVSENNADTSGAYGGIALLVAEAGYYCTNNVIGNNLSVNNSNSNHYGIYSDNWLNKDNAVTGNVFRNHLTAAMFLDRNTNVIANNSGYSTSGYGQATVLSGQTFVTGTHGLPYAPSSGELTVTPTRDLGSGNTFWVDNITAASFQINVRVAVTANTTFNWKI